MTIDAPNPPLGRNDPCRCGSGRKYKKCCLAKDEAAAHAALEKEWARSEKSFHKNKNQVAKETPSAAPKPAGPMGAHTSRHRAFIPPQMNLPRRSGGG